MTQFRCRPTRMHWKLTSPLWSLCVFVLCLYPLDATAQGTTFDMVVSPFLKQHCYACHGPKKQQSQVRFDNLQGMDVGNRNLWTMVYERVVADEMPPRQHPQPTKAEKKRFLDWIRKEQKAIGVGGTRRLNRRELSAALQDVTGRNVDFAAGLPGDGKVGGFDTGADGLQDAADTVAQWLEVTRRAVDGIYFLESVQGENHSADLLKLKDPNRYLRDWRKKNIRVGGARFSRGSQLGKGLYLEPRAAGERQALSLEIPPPSGRKGIWRLSVTVSALMPDYDGVPHPHLWVKMGGKYLDYREITAKFDQPKKLVYQAHLGDLAIGPRGLEIRLSNKVEVPYAVRGFENEDRSRKDRPVPGGTGLYRPKFDRRKLPPEKQPAPHIVLHGFTIEPNVVTPWPPAEWKADVGEIQDDFDSAKKLLKLWMVKAWRRPVTTDEQARFLNFYKKLRASKMSFDDSLRAAFQSVLLSAPFRYQSSPAHPDPTTAQYAIASRLSFMLTGAPPDDELRKLAAAKKLREPRVLGRQVDRLLAGPQGQDFFHPFIMQWLEMEQPITIAQADLQKQDFRFARHLKASMRQETISYITKLFVENRPAKELIVSDWTMMNDTLARHYGYKGIEGAKLRKVKLRPNDPRGGGILGHAGLQSMLCWMGENWVIYRGAWALRHILDKPPPPPPLEVPELNPSEGKNRGKTFRQLLVLHQNDARCAVCHKDIDPVGFAFQNFDISGRWRDVEHEHYSRDELDGRIAWKGVGKPRPVDATGNLPRGEKFKTFTEFKQVVVKHYQKDMVRGLLKNLMIYGTGRLPGIDEMVEIRSIMKSHRADGYRLGDLLKAVVRSRAFLEQHESLPIHTPTIGRRN
ncbi:MAG: DUF1592 domain-containing protein [Gemmataceae bacterium]